MATSTEAVIIIFFVFIFPAYSVSQTICPSPASQSSTQFSSTQACSSLQFICGNGRCITAKERCNRYDDCGDNSDERNCLYNSSYAVWPSPSKHSLQSSSTQACSNSQFTCDNGVCIKASRRCDRYDDCGDKSDERNCGIATPQPPPQLTCNYCLGDTVADCNKRQASIPCFITVFPLKFGTTHCYTAAGLYKYQNGSEVKHTGVARGCINCTDKVSACAQIALGLKAVLNWTLLDCNIKCCTGANCNNQSVNVASPTTPPTPQRHNLFPYGPEQNDDEFSLNDNVYYDYCLKIKTHKFGLPFFGERHYKLHVGISRQMANDDSLQTNL